MYLVFNPTFKVIELNFDEGDVEFDDSGIVMAGTRWVVLYYQSRPPTE